MNDDVEKPEEKPPQDEPQEDQGSEQPPPEEPQYKTITQKEFDELYEKHQERLKLNEKDRQLDKYKTKRLILNGYDLSAWNLNNANLEASIINYSKLFKTQLQDANLKKTDLKGTFLKSSHLKYSSLQRANLEGANLEDANLFSAQLFKANLEDTNLKNTDFTEVNLTGANLKGARIENAIFHEANLWWAELQNSNLTNIDLRKANLSNTNFLNAILHKANLQDTKTSGIKFGGADLTDAKLPDAIAKFELLKTVEESSKLTRTLFLTLLIILAFSFLTTISSTDPQILNGNASLLLPLFQTKISTKIFYFWAPLTILFFAFYFQFYLYKHYLLFSKLPAYFTDGVPVDQKVFPWLLNTWTQNYFPRLQRSLFQELQIYIVIFITWCLPVIVLFGFFLNYLVKHDEFISNHHFIIFVSTMLFSGVFIFRIENAIFNKKPFYLGTLFYFVVSIFLICLILPIYPFTPSELPNEKTTGIFHSYQKFLLDTFYIANFRNKNISTKSENWDPSKPFIGVKKVT